LFDWNQAENSAANTGAAVKIKLHVSGVTSAISGMEGFIKSGSVLATHKSHIEAFDDVLASGMLGSGVNWTASGEKYAFEMVYGDAALGLITRRFVPADNDTRNSLVPEGETIATKELMNDYLTSSKTVDCSGKNVYEEFNVTGRLDSQDTVMGQLEEALIAFFEAVNYIPELTTTAGSSVAAAITNVSEQLFLRSWMSRDEDSSAVKKFRMQPDRVKHLLYDGVSTYTQDVSHGSVTDDLIRCVFDQDQLKALAQLIQQSGRFQELPGQKSAVYTDETDFTKILSVGSGQAVEQGDYDTQCKSIVPSFRHGEGIAVIVPVKATVPDQNGNNQQTVQSGYFLVRVFQSFRSQDGNTFAAQIGGIASNAPGVP